MFVCFGEFFWFEIIIKGVVMFKRGVVVYLYVFMAFCGAVSAGLKGMVMYDWVDDYSEVY